MKKSLLISLLMLAATQLHAQYFQTTYAAGAGNDNLLDFGVNTRFGGGHLMSGTYLNTTVSADLIVVKTGTNSAIAPPNFANVYRFTNTASTPLSCLKNEAIELNPAQFTNQRYIMVGQCNDVSVAPVRNLLYVKGLNALGNLVPGAQIMFSIDPAISTQPPYTVFFNNARLCNSGTEVLLTGSVSDPSTTGNVFGFAAKVDLITWTLSWTTVFQLSTSTVTIGWDVIESPYTGDVLVVGETNPNASTVTDGFIQVLTSGTGAPVGSAEIFGIASTLETFKSIDIMNNTGITGNSGFVIGGTTNSGGAGTRHYLCFIDQALNTGTAQLQEVYFSVAGQHSLSQVKERLDQNGDYSYFSVGTHNNGGGLDMLVMRYNSTSGAADAYLYGTASSTDQGFGLDYYDNTNPAVGLATYGTTLGMGIGTGTNFYLVKSYFNGVSGCNESLNMATTGPSSGYLQSSAPSVLPVNTPQSSFNSFRPLTLMRGQFCFSTSISSGSNARTFKPQTDPSGGNQLVQGGFGVDPIQPNPAGENAELQLNVTGLEPMEINITVSDMLGRTYQAGTYPIGKGSNPIRLSLEALQLNKGIYFLQVQSETGRQTLVLYIE